MFGVRGSEWDPVILPVFKTGARHLRGVEGVFDSHTLPPGSSVRQKDAAPAASFYILIVEHRAGVEPAMRALQARALATWRPVLENQQ